MNFTIRHLLLGTSVALVTLAAPVAQAQQAPAAAPAAGPKPEQLIKWRQSAYQVIAWNNGRIKASLEGSFNKDEVLKAATVIASLANSGLGSLYAPGTDKGKGWHDTSVRTRVV